MVERLQFKEIYGDVTRGQENVQPSRLVLADLHVSKGNMGWKNVKLTTGKFCTPGGCGRILKILAKCYTGKRICGRAGFQCWWDWCVYKDIGKQTYIMQMASKALGFKSFREYATLLLWANATGDFKCKPFTLYRAKNPQTLQGKGGRSIGGGTKRRGWRLIGSTTVPDQKLNAISRAETLPSRFY